MGSYVRAGTRLHVPPFLRSLRHLRKRLHDHLVRLPLGPVGRFGSGLRYPQPILSPSSHHGAAVLPSAPSSGKPCFRRCRRLCADLSPHSRAKTLRLPTGMIYASGLPRTMYLSAWVFPLPQNTPTGGARCRCYPADGVARSLKNTGSEGRLCQEQTPVCRGCGAKGEKYGNHHPNTLDHQIQAHYLDMRKNRQCQRQRMLSCRRRTSKAQTSRRKHKPGSALRQGREFRTVDADNTGGCAAERPQLLSCGFFMKPEARKVPGKKIPASQARV